MKEIFKELSFVRQKFYDTDSVELSSWAYNETKEMVKQCEEELVKRYGSIDANDSYKHLLGEIHELYDLIDNDVLQMQVEIREKLEKYLAQNLFSKLEELESYCEETDRYFETCGRNDC